MTKLVTCASALALVLMLGANAADAKKGGGGSGGEKTGGGTCPEQKFQDCMNKCITNIMISNGSRITQKCSRRCHNKC